MWIPILTVTGLMPQSKLSHIPLPQSPHPWRWQCYLSQRILHTVDEKRLAQREGSVNISCCDAFYPILIIYAAPVLTDVCIDYWQSSILLWAAWDSMECLGCHFDLVCVYSQQKLIHTLHLSVTIGFRVPLRKDLEPKKREAFNVNKRISIFTKVGS